MFQRRILKALLLVRKLLNTHEDSAYSSNNENDESNQDCQLLMAFEEQYVDKSNDEFMDALIDLGT